MTRFIATVFYVGLLRPGPGTWGSAAALPLMYIIHLLGGFPLLAIMTLVVFVLGWWATMVETKGKGDHDPSEIVIDEVAGQWIALWPVSFGAWHQGMDVTALWPGWITAFLAFRLFDIFKPWPVSWADRKSTPLGVMLDDVLAGYMAAIVVVIFGVLYHAVLI
ncbi:phosphatidylglycerophosphatase A family protein [Actibacterium pelagium]|uniref:Phosphatidylglycerophosphatase A n=1 Tax=Actibacterium pelagium TaxID=2029103 RepID=A0A917ACA2_9RHOB|nr:phosphatidylglycerophosphatase A [Actibacterium pelagium]GGE42946.1 phosphatidylglycerophosphatase A [Actibacterium pelagium]